MMLGPYVAHVITDFLQNETSPTSFKGCFGTRGKWGLSVSGVSGFQNHLNKKYYIVKSNLNAFPSKGGNIPTRNHLERFHFVVCRQSLAPERHGLHHGPINQQRKLWIKAWNAWRPVMINQFGTLQELTPPQFIFWFQLWARSSQLLTNDYFPFRLEKHGTS